MHITHMILLVLLEIPVEMGLLVVKPQISQQLEMVMAILPQYLPLQAIRVVIEILLKKIFLLFLGSNIRYLDEKREAVII